MWFKSDTRIIGTSKAVSSRKDDWMRRDGSVVVERGGKGLLKGYDSRGDGLVERYGGLC